jgi:hypothetical protein
MNRIPLLLVSLLGLLGCGQQVEEDVCHDLCTNLAGTCGYEAFPDLESCIQGCRWNAEQGADVGGQLLCVQTADCDTFAILECEHAYGIE